MNWAGEKGLPAAKKPAIKAQRGLSLKKGPSNVNDNFILSRLFLVNLKTYRETGEKSPSIT